MGLPASCGLMLLSIYFHQLQHHSFQLVFFNSWLGFYWWRNILFCHGYPSWEVHGKKRVSELKSSYILNFSFLILFYKLNIYILKHIWLLLSFTLPFCAGQAVHLHITRTAHSPIHSNPLVTRLRKPLKLQPVFYNLHPTNAKAVHLPENKFIFC